ncbi:MAG TPA: hypothetical protein VMB20_09105 [Candidatus Acidoferrum sp.]|nr:hypothetical protein [Candidatus Acidoferrum sp.]
MLALLLATAIAPGTYTYNATLAGANVGTSTLVVKSVGTTTVIDEKVTGTISGSGASASDTLVLGADLGPLTYQMNAMQDGSPLKDSATIANATANITDVHGKSASFDLLANTKHFVVADFGLFAGLLPLPAQMRAWDDAPVLVVVPMLGRSVALAPDAGASAQRPASVPASDVALVFSGEAPFTIWYDPSTNVPDEIDVTAQGLTVTRQR